MKKFYFFSIVFAFLTLLNVNVYAQNDTVFENYGGLITVESGGGLYIGGTAVSSGTNASITNKGKIEIKKDLKSYGAFIVDPLANDSLLFSNDTVEQKIEGVFNDTVSGPNQKMLGNVYIKKHATNDADRRVVLIDTTGGGRNFFSKSLHFVDDANSATFDGIVETGNNTLVVQGNVTGHQTPNNTGVYEDGRYVQGKLARYVSSNNTYVFPVGHATGSYNPVAIEITGSGVNTFISVEPQIPSGGVGTIYVQYTTDCTPYAGGINPQWVEHFEMQPIFWNINQMFGNNNFDYQVVLSPNSLVASPVGNYFRAIKADNVLVPGPIADWTPYATGSGRGTPCVAGTVFYEVPGETFNGFSRFGITGNGNGAGLPVELISLRADPIDNQFIKVSWITATEINNAGFEVLRSVDGIHFDFIAYQQGAGNSSTQRSYFYDDHEVEKNKVYYYRLRQIDYDGAAEFTHIVSAMVLDADHWVVSPLLPNPATNRVTFFVETGKTRPMIMTVYNTLGQIVSTKEHQVQKGKVQFTVSVTDLASGNYFLGINFADNFISQRFTVLR